MIAAFFLTSAMSVDNKLEVGEKAPKIETIEGINVVNDANSEPKTRVISFWNPKKPASRIANKNLSLKYGQNASDVEFISICTDSNENLMAQVMKLDGVNVDKNYSYSNISPRVFKDYDVENNPRAFVINPDGKIAEIL